VLLAVLVLPILNAVVPGPTTSNVQVTPNPTNCAATVTLTAKISSGGFTITKAEYFIDTTGPNGTGTPMNAQDGAFDSDTENVIATVTGLSQGDHTIYVHGECVCGGWGTYQSITLTVTCVNPIAAFIPLKNYHLRQVNTCLGVYNGELTGRCAWRCANIVRRNAGTHRQCEYDWQYDLREQ
ncbi:MAG: hypothetical protein KAV48_00870, partial [Methanomicrobia archaeon]|nr:hypothetical protein [Methanomicrobia archaeon]